MSQSTNSAQEAAAQVLLEKRLAKLKRKLASSPPK